MLYTVVHATSPAKLAKLVNEYISEGWRPQGGIDVIVHMAAFIFVFFLPFRATYYQAMIRDD